MGLDDRDYMRARYRDRGHGVKWNDRAGRVEGAWFDPTNRGFGYQGGRYRHASGGGRALRWLPLVLGLFLVAIPAFQSIKRDGWLPDGGAVLPFPETGSVTVRASLNAAGATSRMTVVTADAHAVVQLFEPRSGHHVLSVYVRKNDRTTIAVPPGFYRMKIAEGQAWHGPRKFFGASTAYETVVRPMIFTPEQGSGIDLHRRPDGRLRTRPDWSGPKPL